MGKNKRYERNKTKAVRAYLQDWMLIDEVAGEDRPMKDGLHEIVEGYKEYKEIEGVDIEGVLQE
jgi:hypothetical protein